MARGLSLRTIGHRLRRDHRTLGRELARSAKYFHPYLPSLAQDRAVRVAQAQRYTAPLKEPLVFLYVREHLRQGWSPETIAGRLRLDYPGYSVSDETIYRYIYKRANRKLRLWQYLVIGRPKRRKWNGRPVRRRTKIPEAVSIELRPKVVLRRKQLGHWETDDLEGVKSEKQALSVSVERVTRHVQLDLLTDQRAATKAAQLIHRLRGYPGALRRTLTADNGPENSRHQVVTGRLGLPVYFCHPYHSWEKGTVENTVGRVRRFIPKGTPLSTITPADVKQVEITMNNTPRKCLGYLTPYEKLEKILGRMGNIRGKTA